MAKKVAEKSKSTKSTTVAKSPVKKHTKPTKPVGAKKTIPKVGAKKTAAKASLKTVPAKKTIARPVKNIVVAAPKITVKKVIEKPAAKKNVNLVSLVKISVKAQKVSAKPDKKAAVESKPLPVIVNSGKLKPVKSILISQPKPELGKSPYIDIAAQFKIKLDWRPFTQVEGIKAADFRKDKIYIEQYSSIIFTSRFAVEQYFRICEELRIKIKEDNKYFCHNEAIALYLQKFINYRKRKVFFGDGKLPKLMELIMKHKDNGKFLLPCSDVRDKTMAESLNKHEIPYSEAVIYKTVASQLSDLSDVKYDMLVFFNPSAIDSLYTNFPKFKQDETRLAIFGNTTADAVKAHKLNINIFAPTPENPSLVDAIKKYIIEANKK